MSESEGSWAKRIRFHKIGQEGEAVGRVRVSSQRKEGALSKVVTIYFSVVNIHVYSRYFNINHSPVYACLVYGLDV